MWTAVVAAFIYANYLNYWSKQWWRPVWGKCLFFNSCLLSANLCSERATMQKRWHNGWIIRLRIYSKLIEYQYPIQNYSWKWPDPRYLSKNLTNLILMYWYVLHIWNKDWLSCIKHLDFFGKVIKLQIRFDFFCKFSSFWCKETGSPMLLTVSRSQYFKKMWLFGATLDTDLESAISETQNLCFSLGWIVN